MHGTVRSSASAGPLPALPTGPADPGSRRPAPDEYPPAQRTAQAEVAALAGISPEYYTRPEQGRQHHPSSEVLDALASALQLDDDARRHLHHLGVGNPVHQTDPVVVTAPVVPEQPCNCSSH
ncbi:helix-turn-helix domain-containing protein [Streptomyces sp. NPDC088348]|uniref:helix-turn-helix domain-containing protein n=1 Tax=Streptomyces sp. NPDC088348 TaxID=3365853 RepID=UPI00380BA036